MNSYFTDADSQLILDHNECDEHSGRKTFLTSLAAKGVSVFVLASLAGHRNISTTQRYITVNDAMLARAVELL